ncbi:MAG: hypothetical protein AAGF88_04035 [Pseudomonadota bacterium]
MWLEFISARPLLALYGIDGEPMYQDGGAQSAPGLSAPRLGFVGRGSAHPLG